MTVSVRVAVCCLLGGSAGFFTHGTAVAEEPGLPPIPEIERRIPPRGIEIPAELKAKLEAELVDFEDEIWLAGKKADTADIGVLVKAVRFALENGEIFSEKELPLLTATLDLARARLSQFQKGETPWRNLPGLTVRGYVSSVDGSWQPYGLEIPEGLDLGKPVPLLVWLHGRGDKTTDLHFIHRCLAKSQAFGGKVADQKDAIIVHPFGRQCVGWKHAGEIDVLEVIDHLSREYPIDPDRVALAGFSMGGAGAWHIGAHYADRFCAVHAGAGFAETARYNRLQPEEYPPPWEQILWGLYDAPDYVRNLFNLPVLAYSGEIDKQIQAADLMAEAFTAEGGALDHIIGPGMGHKYDDESVRKIWAWLREAWKKGRNRQAEEIHLQTRTLRYPRMRWLRATGLGRHWIDSRADAQWDPQKKQIRVETVNIDSLELSSPDFGDLGGCELQIDGGTIRVEPAPFLIDVVALRRSGAGWEFGENRDELKKKPGLQGPIDDAFLSAFVVVPPSETPREPLVARWVDFELNYFRTRWRELMRGELPEEEAESINSGEIADKNLILWGDPASNPLIAEISTRLPVRWTRESFIVNGKEYSARDHVPVLIFPNPLNRDRYVVINSGLTFRAAHDRTNSLQNPKLPDWAVIDLSVLPGDQSPGGISAAGFFDENWQFRPEKE